MATIFKRKDGCHKNPWRVQIRKKGYPRFDVYFAAEEEAVKWVNEHEDRYLSNPSLYIKIPYQANLVERVESLEQQLEILFNIIRDLKK